MLVQRSVSEDFNVYEDDVKYGSKDSIYGMKGYREYQVFKGKSLVRGVEHPEGDDDGDDVVLHSLISHHSRPRRCRPMKSLTRQMQV